MNHEMNQKSAGLNLEAAPTLEPGWIGSQK